MQRLDQLAAVLIIGLSLAAPAGAAPRLEIGSLTRRLEMPGLRACYTARLPGATGDALRFLAAGTTIYSLAPDGRVWPLMTRNNLFGVVTDPEVGALLCTSRGVFATRDGRSVRRLTALVFNRVIAAPVGGLFVRSGEGLYGFDGKRFLLIRTVPWRNLDSVAVEPGGAIWFVGAYRKPDGSAAPTGLYVSRVKDGQPVIEEPLPPGAIASAVAEYFGGIVATVDGKLLGTTDGGENWVMLDQFGRPDLTLTSLPLYEAQPWQALWIGVRNLDGGPAPLWFDDYTTGLVAQPINAAQVLQVTADLSRATVLFVADEALFEAPYRVVDETASH